MPSKKLLLALLLLPTLATAQTARDLTDIGVELYQQANSPTALARMRKDLLNAPEAYLVSASQPGYLVLPGKRRRRVPAMKYNVAQHLLEVQDSTGSHVWPPGSLHGFWMGLGANTRHFRSYKVRNGATTTDFVEVVTVDDDSPIVVAVQHNYLHQDAEIHPVLRTETRKALTEISQVVLVGSGFTPNEPLRPLVLTERNVTRLFGPRMAEIKAFAAKEHLSYTDLGQVLRMVEYYNQRPAR